MAMIFRKGLAVAAAATAMTLAVHAAQAQNCMDVLSRTPEASSFVAALVRTGQTTLLRGSGPFTILAPTNAAVNKLPVSFRTNVFGSAASSEQEMDPVLAPAVVNAHIVDGKHTAAEVQAGASTQSVTTRNGNELKLVRGADGRFSLQPQGRGRRAVEGHVVRADIPCSNGVIHLVDTVLIRPQ
jgi:uncharacterized surface protein with fasciclin (FAS1) repeats